MQHGTPMARAFSIGRAVCWFGLALMVVAVTYAVGLSLSNWRTIRV